MRSLRVTVFSMAPLLAAMAVAACGDDDEGSLPGIDAGASDSAMPDDDSDAEVPASAIKLFGELRGPVGTKVALSSGGESLPLTIPPFVSGAGADRYNTVDFVFEHGADEGIAYELTIPTQPAAWQCSVYKGKSGTLPVATGDVKVGCEHRFDHVSRSTDDKVVGTFFESTDVVVGGANDAVGVTSAGHGEGRFVAFVSTAPGLAGSSDAHRQIFWRDRLTGETRLVSANAEGDEGDDDSAAPAISSDGLHVAFESRATNLVEGDTNGLRDVFVWTVPGTAGEGIERVSLGAGGLEADGESFSATLSGDGQVVAFSTSASNLTGGVADVGTINVVRRDRETNGNTLISANADSDGIGGDRAMLSEDGNRLVFWSFGADITPGDGNGIWDIFVYQHDDGSYRRVSKPANGERDQGTESSSRVVSPAISGDGHFVAFATTAAKLVAGDTNELQDVFVVDLDGSKGVRRVSVGPSGEQGDGNSPAAQGERVALSYDGRWVAFTSSATNFGAAAGNMYLRDLDTDELRVITDFTYGVGTPSLSRGAAYVAFGAADKLDPRFESTGLFAHFTGITDAFFWVR